MFGVVDVDEVFGSANLMCGHRLIPEELSIPGFATKYWQSVMHDYLVWYAKDTKSQRRNIGTSTKTRLDPMGVRHTAIRFSHPMG